MPKVKSTCYTNRNIRRLRAKITNYDLELLKSRNLNEKFSDSSSSDDENDIEISSESAREEFTDELFIDVTSVNENDAYLSSSEALDDNNEFEEQFNTGTQNFTSEYYLPDTNENQTDSEQEIEKILDFDFEENRTEEIVTDSENENSNNSSESEDFDEESSSNPQEFMFKQSLQNWALLYKIPIVALTALLVLILQFTKFVLPRDARTLLKTPRNTEIKILSDGGEYHHLGLKRAVDLILNNSDKNSVDLIINIDGLPLSNSSTKSLWPIMCSDFHSKDVYLVAAYHGEHHPSDSNEFLAEFTNEMSSMINTGVMREGKKIDINFSALVCDVPAKKLILKVKGHTGYDSCHKCEIKGEGLKPKYTIRKGKKMKKRVCFPGIEIDSY